MAYTLYNNIDGFSQQVFAAKFTLYQQSTFAAVDPSDHLFCCLLHPAVRAVGALMLLQPVRPCAKRT